MTRLRLRSLSTPFVAPLDSVSGDEPRLPALPPRPPAAASSPAFAAAPPGMPPSKSPEFGSPIAPAETNICIPCTAGAFRSRCSSSSRQPDRSCVGSLSPPPSRGGSALGLAPYPAATWIPLAPPPKPAHNGRPRAQGLTTLSGGRRGVVLRPLSFEMRPLASRVSRRAPVARGRSRPDSTHERGRPLWQLPFPIPYPMPWRSHHRSRRRAPAAARFSARPPPCRAVPSASLPGALAPARSSGRTRSAAPATPTTDTATAGARSKTRRPDASPGHSRPSPLAASCRSSLTGSPRAPSPTSASTMPATSSALPTLRPGGRSPVPFPLSPSGHRPGAGPVGASADRTTIRSSSLFAVSLLSRTSPSARAPSPSTTRRHVSLASLLGATSRWTAPGPPARRRSRSHQRVATAAAAGRSPSFP